MIPGDERGAETGTPQVLGRVSRRVIGKPHRCYVSVFQLFVIPTNIPTSDLIASKFSPALAWAK